ncbi:MAG: hypothetical protein V4812_01070 [Pseudomonadota bacterium]
MYLRPIIAPITAALLLSGCAATIDQSGLEQRTAQAIGQPTGQFTISERSEETGGRINYSVKTKDGGTYRCYMYSATGFQKAMSFGMTPHSDAICTAMAGTPALSGQGNNGASGTCNALLKAAGRC